MSTVNTGNTPGMAVGANDQDLAPGQEVGEYRIENVLGQGGFGTVYAAVHPLIGKRAAIKVLARKYSADPTVVSRFVAEARAVNQIRHRNIIDIFAFGQLADGRHYYVMEYLEGQPLDAYLRDRGPLTLDEALPILRAIARALDAAHGKGIAHRDLKPENIFLAHDTDGDTYPKLLDFGIAKLMAPEDDVRHRTGTGVPIGTPYYMSPEQCRGKDVDHLTDVYSFGIVVYRMLTGTFPFEGDDYVELLYKQVNEEAAPPSTRNASLPASVDAAIAWMMQKDRTKRPPTVVEAVHALDPDASRTPSLPGAVKTGRGSRPSIPPKRQVTPDALAATTAPDQAPVALPSAPTMAASSQLPTGTGDAKLPTAPASGGKGLIVAILAVLVLAGAGVAAYVLVVAKKTPDATKDVVELPPVGSGSQSLPLATPVDAAVVAEAIDAAAPTPSSVLITLEGVPKGTQVFRNGARVGLAPKFEIAYGTKEVPLELRAPSYEPTPLVIVPNADQTQTVTLTKTKTSHSQHTQPTDVPPDKDSLADPFAKKKTKSGD
ncbi:MAG TPA: protein kinase [Kofleriaceae bacterium]|nr:protein kinase [Kofleriaceae bacterium]